MTAHDWPPGTERFDGPLPHRPLTPFLASLPQLAVTDPCIGCGGIALFCGSCLSEEIDRVLRPYQDKSRADGLELARLRRELSHWEAWERLQAAKQEAER